MLFEKHLLKAHILEKECFCKWGLGRISIGHLFSFLLYIVKMLVSPLEEDDEGILSDA